MYVSISDGVANTSDLYPLYDLTNLFNILEARYHFFLLFRETQRCTLLEALSDRPLLKSRLPAHVEDGPTPRTISYPFLRQRTYKSERPSSVLFGPVRSVPLRTSLSFRRDDTGNRRSNTRFIRTRINFDQAL